MRAPEKWILASLTVGVVVALAMPAAAVSTYVDMLTSSSLGDFHARGTHHEGDASFPSTVLGSGLGSGWVREGSPVSYQHDFLPDTPVDSVSSAWLTIWLADDFFGDLQCVGFRSCSLEGETARIQISDGVSDRTFYQGGVSSFPGTFAFGNVTGSVQSSGDELFVTIFADDGDFLVKGSALIVAFLEPGLSLGSGGLPTSAIPEPSAALLFGAGAFLVARRATRRS